MTNNTAVIYDVCSSENRPQAMNYLAAFLIVFLSIISMSGNGLVLISFATCNQLRQQKGSYFVINLAVADFLCSVYVMIPCAVYLFESKWRVVGFPCTFHGINNSTLITSSNMSLAAINIDRAIAITKPFEYRNLVTAFRVRIVIVYIWIHCLGLAFIFGVTGWITFGEWELMCSPLWSSKQVALSLIAAILCFGLPSSLLLISNIFIVYAIRRSRTVVFQNDSSPSGPQLAIKKYTRTLRSLYFLVLVHFLCVPPYYIVKIGLAVLGRREIMDGWCLLPVSLLFTSAAVNPFIYTLLRRDHRKAFLDTLRMIYTKLKTVYIFLFGDPLLESQ
ncbi:g_PROTEIN_RECEP_F1_2 domain-containing protein [Trichonephila clavata]|uniref:G_PROTEIN_RECEP_F1_2 domain-containing protein n=1 Tax=Trichonephila clavata TaxID=2740835 RepID=A0A8X6M3U7_TRICU|nr:g_PROTEIN_RECEP_F1_2 domain-containing protein [Trichonephila clavata]